MTKRIWLMTGLSSGFSKEIAQHLLTNGDAVIGTVIDYLCVTDLASKYPLDFHPQIFSEYYEQELSSAIKRIEVSGKHLDALVITDTTVTLGASEFMAPEAVKEQVSVNFTQTILLVNAAIKHFRKQGKGSIIMIGAPEMVKSMPGAGLYFSIKKAIESYLLAVKKEVEHLNIDVKILYSNDISPLIDRVDIQDSGLFSPYDNGAASQIYTRVYNDQSRISGADIILNKISSSVQSSQQKTSELLITPQQ